MIKHEECEGETEAEEECVDTETAGTSNASRNHSLASQRITKPIIAPTKGMQFCFAEFCILVINIDKVDWQYERRRVESVKLCPDLAFYLRYPNGFKPVNLRHNPETPAFILWKFVLPTFYLMRNKAGESRENILNPLL